MKCIIDEAGGMVGATLKVWVVILYKVQNDT